MDSWISHALQQRSTGRRLSALLINAPSPSLCWSLAFGFDHFFSPKILFPFLSSLWDFFPLSPSEQLSHSLRSHELLCCGRVWLIILLAFIKSVDWHSGREAAGPEGEAIESQQDLCPAVYVYVGHVRLLSSKTALGLGFVFFDKPQSFCLIACKAQLKKKKKTKKKTNKHKVLEHFTTPNSLVL